MLISIVQLFSCGVGGFRGSPEVLISIVQLWSWEVQGAPEVLVSILQLWSWEVQGAPEVLISILQLFSFGVGRSVGPPRGGHIYTSVVQFWIW